MQAKTAGQRCDVQANFAAQKVQAMSTPICYYSPKSAIRGRGVGYVDLSMIWCGIFS